MKLFITENIKHLRKKNNITQTQLAAITDISVYTLRKYEISNRTPRVEHLVTIADTFKISLDELIRIDLSKQ